MGRRQVRRAGVITAAALLVAALAAYDLTAAGQSVFARAGVAAIDRYKQHVSPRISGVVQCRFHPTCSAYGRESMRKHGFIRGGGKTVARIARCGPWTPAGTVDEP